MPSTIVSTTDAAAAARARCPRTVAANVQIKSPITTKPERPVVGRVRELNHGLHAGIDLHHRAVAERPVVSAAVSRACCAYQSAPEDSRNEVDEYSPGEAAQRGRGKALWNGGNGSGRHERRPRMTLQGVKSKRGGYAETGQSSFSAASAALRG